MKTIKGPGLFLGQFAGDAAPFNSWDAITKWAADIGYKGVQVPSWASQLIDLKKAATSKDYCDEFAEAHIKELVVREAVGAAIPLAGVGCAIASRLTSVAIAFGSVTAATAVEDCPSGTVIGGLSAAGTVGSLAGVFLTGFVLVTLLPVAMILLVTASACLVLAVVTAAVPARRTVTSTAVAAAVLATAMVAVPGRCDVDTVYYCASVRTDAADADVRVLVLDDLDHSAVDLSDAANLRFAYTRRFAEAIDTAFAPGVALDAVHVGGGGFTMPRWLAATRPGSASTVLEVDKGVVDLGRRELGVGTIPGVDVRIGDARSLLAALPDASADVVVGDAFGARSVPWHLATAEFVADVHRVLRHDGVYVLNVIDHDPWRLLAAEVATLAHRFPHVALLARPEQLAPGGGGNAVIVASDLPIDTAALAGRAALRGEPASVLDAGAALRFARDAPVLTDDWAPVDQLIS